MLGFCTDPQVMHAHPTIDIDGQECIVIACKHTFGDLLDSAQDHFVYRARDGSCRLIVYDVDGAVVRHHKLAEDLSTKCQTTGKIEDPEEASC